MAKRRIKVVERKLGKEGFPFGQAIAADKLIEIDPRQDAPNYMDTLVHETIHIVRPELSEEAVLELANKVSTVLWDQGYRKVILK